MRNVTFLILSILFINLSQVAPVIAAPDQYMGDASIYLGMPPVDNGGKPNILFIIDNSSATENPASGQPYVTSTIYNSAYINDDQPVLGTYETEGIYAADQQGDFVTEVTDLANLNCLGVDANNNSVDVIRSALLTYGTYTASGSDEFPALAMNGGGCSNSAGGAVYALGNYLNYLKDLPEEQVGVTCEYPIIVKSVKNAAQWGYFQLTQTHNPTCQPAANNCDDDVFWTSPPYSAYNTATVPSWSATGADGSGSYTMPSEELRCTDSTALSQREIFYEAIRGVVGSAAGAVNFAAMSYDQGGQKGGIITADMADLSVGIPSTYNAATGLNEPDLVDCEDAANASLAQCAWLSQIPGPDRDGDGQYFNDDATDGYTILSSQTSRPQAEALFDAGYYFGAFPTANSGINTTLARMAADDPMRNQCDLNHIILITNGLSNESTRSQFTDHVGNADYDNWADEGIYGLGTHWLDDVAKHLYEFNSITTHTILAFQADDPLLKNTSVVDGGGTYHNAQNANQLADALKDILTNIVNPDETSFVAPVVPSSTTNRTVSSNRVYLGLFKPQKEGHWHGNVKKYGLNQNNQLTEPPPSTSVDVGGPATDVYGNFSESSISFWSLQNDVIPSAGGDIDPSSEDPNATLGDGGSVDSGGVGGVLLKRMQAVSAYRQADDFSNTQSHKRKIFTLNPAAPTTPIMLDWYNTSLTPSMFGLPDTERSWWSGSSGMSTQESSMFLAGDSLITADELEEIKMRNLLRYVHGFQSIDADSADIWNVRDWVMADVLHSRPVVFNLSEYGAAEENLCAADVDLTNGEKYNSSYIFVGTNGGMLHAFRDCDGSEAWAYVPESNLDTLKYLPEDDHTSYVDSAPSIFYFDVNADGAIGSGDKAVLIVGQRRGGGKDTLDTNSERGSYYALDITDPENPTLLWDFSFDATTAPQLAETWALPKVGKVKVPDTEDEYRWLAFFGAGYDNNEDFRYGNTHLFPSSVDGSVSVSNAPTGGSVTGTYNGATLSLTSPAESTAGFAMRGKGLMAVEVAYSTRNPTTGKFETVVDPSVRSSLGSVVWSQTPSSMEYSSASDVRVLDLNQNGGWIDHLYIGDTGGNLWRVDTSDRSLSWTAERVFSSNGASASANTYPGGYSNGISDSSNGRKFFYPPSVALASDGYPWVCFSTGDREHPLNLAVTDRMYCIRDYGQASVDLIDESNLVDVTENYLQEIDAATDTFSIQQQLDAITDKLDSKPGSPAADGNVYYGWYIRLDGKDRVSSGDPGEKALAEPVIFNNEVFYSTYQPKIGSRATCEAGNTGWSRLYRVDLETGEAVYNYYEANDVADTSTLANARAAGGETEVLKRKDRVYDLGEGIPSGVVPIVDVSGRVSLLISSSDRVEGIGSSNATVSFPLYWLQR